MKTRIPESGSLALPYDPVASGRKLWTVLADEKPVAVVAARRKREAWRILAALVDQEDLPPDCSTPHLVPCSPEMAGEIWLRARRLGIAERFLARVTNGAFITFIGALQRRPALKTCSSC